MKRSIVVTGIVGTAVLVGACGLLIDPDVLIAGLNDADAAVVSAEGGASDASAQVDASRDAPIDPECRPSGPEVCDDGIDDDCNGKVDCEDPACAPGFACFDAPPEGWSLVLLSEKARPGCPAGYGAPTDVRVLEGDGSFTCACSCGNNCGSTITLTKGTESTCTVAPSTDTLAIDPTDKCTGKAFDLPVGFVSAASDGGTCAPKDQATKDDPTDGRTCAAPQKAGAGCPGRQRCLPKPEGFATCVAKAGYAVCPTSTFTKQRRSGTAANDQRTCAGCACDAKPCDVDLELWTHPVCQGTVATELNATCTATTGVTNVKGYKARVTSGCTPSVSSTPQGAVVFENEQTICCP